MTDPMREATLSGLSTSPTTHQFFACIAVKPKVQRVKKARTANKERVCVSSNAHRNYFA